MFPLTSQPHLAHALFESAALVLGAHYYRVLKRRAGIPLTSLMGGGQFMVLLGCIFGAALGNKLAFWIEMPHLLPLYWTTPAVWLGGQSMVGGLLGGLLGVELGKLLSGFRSSTGDAFVFPVLLGLMIGRIGCFVAGLDDGTYGLPSSLPWAIDFGDGISRHPTQLYEIVFAALLWVTLYLVRGTLAAYPGILFRIMLIAYLFWRLAVDALKPNPFEYIWGLSGIQLLCLSALLIYLPSSIMQWHRLRDCR